MPTSVRLDPRSQRLLEKLARKRSQSKSDVIRDAIEALATEEKPNTGKLTLYESISDLIGCVEGGPANLSVQTGKRFRELLSRRSSNG